MSLPVEDAAVVGETLADTDLTRPKHTLIVTPAPSAMARLQRLHATAAGLAEDAPDIIAHPEAVLSLEQALLQAMADCLATREGRKNTLAQGQHAIVMRRFRRVVEEHPGGSALHPGNLQGDQGFTAGVARVLPGAFGNGAKTLPPAAPHAAGTAGPAPG
jgi:hypothetical protein